MADGQNLEKGKLRHRKRYHYLFTPEEQKPKEELTMLEEPAAERTHSRDFCCRFGMGVGSAVNRVKKAREIMLSRANEAADYIVENKLTTDSGLE
jgi:hypothetical protein